MGAAAEIFLVFLRLGLTSFGGPVAHIAYFREAFVTRRRWLGEADYAALVGFCQVLPGPTSSQVAMGLGLMRARVAGLTAAWLGFTLPSALLMAGFALMLGRLGAVANAPWVHGLKLAAVAVVAQALWAMARSLAPDMPRRVVAGAGAMAALLLPGMFGQVLVIGLGALAGAAILKTDAGPPPPAPPLSSHHAIGFLVAFALLLAGLPLLAPASSAMALFSAFFRSGALVFGGGHVVLPLLQHALVPQWIANAPFLAGYGAAQAMPGPLFSFAAFIGAEIGGPGTALLCLAAIYLPSLLLVAGGWPLWRLVAERRALRAALAGINAAVVGLLAAALVTPVGTGAIFSVADAAIALAALALLLWRVPSWAVVGFGALAASLVAAWLH